MTKRYLASVSICFVLLLALLMSSPVQADEANGANTMRLGVGLGYTFIHPENDHAVTLYLSFQYAFASFYRMGMNGHIDYYYRPYDGYFVNHVFVFTPLWTHEFIVWRNETFELAPRLGLGYQLYYASSGWETGDDARGIGALGPHGLAFNFGLGFGWVITDLLLLRFGIDYGLTTLLGGGERGFIIHQLSAGLNIVFRL
ncbi:MAG: hypothetical protein FWC40_00390 [Proteobacteria bacterium]|nr:hypothetical protein [Pseudomonadota bacterium]